MKIMTLLASAVLAMTATSAMAQTDLETFRFVDKDGNVVTDGSTITVSETEVKGGQLQISTGLFVENTTDEEQAVGLGFSIDHIDNGETSCCFPSQCVKGTDHVGTYTTEPGGISAKTKADFVTEWFPASYGTCTMTFNLLVNKIGSTTIIIAGQEITQPTYDEFKAYGPKVTVNFVYADPTGIDGVVDNSGAKVVSRYNAAGMQVNSEVKGLNIEKLSNGKTIKRIVK